MSKMSAFEFFLRTGRRLNAPSPSIETKFNPWHDPDDGRFTFAGQGRHIPRKTGTPRATGSARWRPGGFMSPQEVAHRAANAMRMYDVHRVRGMSPEQAAGWAANAEAESRGDFRSQQAVGPGRGLFQWGDGHREKLFEKRYGHLISESTENEQLDFRDWELVNNEAGAARRIALAKSAGDIAAAITLHYERPDQKATRALDRANLAEAILRRAKKSH